MAPGREEKRLTGRRAAIVAILVCAGISAAPASSKPAPAASDGKAPASKRGAVLREQDRYAIPRDPSVASPGQIPAPFLAPDSSLSPRTAASPAPIDPQQWQDQYDMTWNDYHPIPGRDWADPLLVPSQRSLKIAVVAVDFPDQPFVITKPKLSDPFGNPQIDPILRSQVPQFYADFYLKPSLLNHGHTINGYWMEQSRGKLGITKIDAFGPYMMPRHLFEYGLNEWNQTGGCPVGPYDCHGMMDTDANLLWELNTQNPSIASNYDVVMRIYAGYDETSVWQEFGEMKFQTQNDVPDSWGPDQWDLSGTIPNWVVTRYVPWTSWLAGQMQWGLSSVRQGESSGTITHELSHFFFSIGDNNNNPFATPYHRVGSGPWDIMDRGSFNGPGGHHMRWVVPAIMGASMPAGHTLRDKIGMSFVPYGQVLRLNRNGLAASGLAVADITARAEAPTAPSLSGAQVYLDGSAPVDHEPACDTATQPLCDGGGPNGGWRNYTLEVVQRIGYDSFTPDNGVLIAKNKPFPQGGSSSEGSSCGYNCFTWVIDAHPENINLVDFYRPNGSPVMRTVGDHRQVNDALFHAGTSSGSQYEYVDPDNNLHFYVLDKYNDAQGILHYIVGVQNPAGAGPQTRGVAVANAQPQTVSGLEGYCHFPLTNTGVDATTDPALHPQDETAYLHNDIYRLSASTTGAGWAAQLANALATASFGQTVDVPVYVTRVAGSSPTATINLTATSVSDATKVSTGTCSVATSPTAVALRSFAARRAGPRAVVLSWRMGTEAGLLGYHLYRNGGTRVTRTLIAARGTTGSSYTYRDRLSRRAPALYRLQGVKLDGSRIWLGSARGR